VVGACELVGTNDGALVGLAEGAVVVGGGVTTVGSLVG
jgi:hypothetical protein